MPIDRWILISIVIVSTISVILLVPRHKVRDAWIIFLFLQVITWPAGLFVVEMEWIEYPIQLFPTTNEYNKTSLLFEFFLFPYAAVLFNLYFPKNKKWAILYYLVFGFFFTGIEVVLERYTELVHYQCWRWYGTVLTELSSLYISRQFYTWYKKGMVEVNTSG